MDVVKNLDKIFSLILKGNQLESNENLELKNLPANDVKILGNASDDYKTQEHLENVLTSTGLLLDIFIKNYETRFDIFIEYIFQQMKSLLRSVSPVKMAPAISQNLFNIVELLIRITVKHPCDKNVAALKSFYLYNLNEIKLKHETKCDGDSCIIEELILHVRISSITYQTIYNSIKESKIGNKNNYVELLFNCMILENNESELFIELVCCSTDALMIQTLIEIIPTFMKLTNNNEILQLIWEKVHNFCNTHNNVDNSRLFIILCYLSDFYFLAENKVMMVNIFTDSTYWISLQNGLTNPDYTVRKEALFLIKTSLNFILENGIIFYCFRKEVEVLGGEKQIDEKLPIIYWETNMTFNKLKDFCTVVEYLEEKQVHIVQPIFSTIEKLLNNTKEHRLDMSWMLIVIEKMLCHDNTKIIREGISNLVKINASCYYEEFIMRKAIKLFLKSLNCTQIYMTDLSSLLEELKSYFEDCSMQENGKHFFRILIEEMCNVQWSSEALFAISYSLQSVKSKKYWEIDEINLMKKLIISGMVNHYTYIRSGIQCHLLMAAINLIDTSIVSLEDIDSLLVCYQRKTTLKWKTILWEYVVKWIRDSYVVKDAQHFVISALGKRNIGRMMILLCESFSDDAKFLRDMKHLMEKILATFVDLHCRPYCDKQVVDYYLATICDIMEEISDDFEFCNFNSYISDIISYIQLRLESTYHIRDFQSCRVYMKYLNTVLNYGRRYLTLQTMMEKWFDETVTDLLRENDSNRILPLQKFIKIRLLNMLIDYFPRDASMIKLYLKKELNSPLTRSSEDAILTKDLLTLWGRMNSEYLHGKWELLSKIDVSPSEVLQVTSADFILSCLEALDLSGSAVLSPLLSVLGKELPSHLDESGLAGLIDAIWSALMERKKNEEFCNLMRSFIGAIFQLRVIRNGKEHMRRMLVDYSRRILQENMTAAATALIKHMQKIEFHEDGIYLFEDFLPRALLFGQLPKKDERLITDVCLMIEKSGLSPLMNDVSSSSEVRARSVQIVLSLNPKNHIDCRFANNLIESLQSLEEKMSRSKTRYFSDSYVHRVKQRLMQALLILLPYLTKEKAEKLWNWSAQKILMENNQPSVRYLQEWLMLLILHRHPLFIDALWTYFDEAWEKRTGSLCSLISIIYHSLKCVPSEEVPDLIERAVETFLPYCMAQHFSVRLYAQVALERLLGTAEALRLKSITEKYGVIMRSLRESIERGNAIKNCTKMQEDFYFSAFHPVEHYSLQTIFFEIPRLTGISRDELISEEVFVEIELAVNESIIPVSNRDNFLVKFECRKWLCDGSKQENFTNNFDGKDEAGGLNFQKKMVPIKCLVPDREDVLNGFSLCSKKVEKDGLVVVASLIDRIPNLGGLSRTCEVFGASELVMASLKYAEDKQFQSLSVTAEKWIAITEVKPFHLSDYIIKMKRNGYTVVAAEQTMNSQPLQSVNFPRKSLLLLGNEKEGIPPALLPLTDICIEIPQMGVIRSLNVHVTGALFVWEYAKQHHFNISPAQVNKNL